MTQDIGVGSWYGGKRHEGEETDDRRRAPHEIPLFPSTSPG